MVCQPKSSGGLGFKNLDLMNRASLMKVGWNLIVSPIILWSQVLLTKYGIDNVNRPHALPMSYGSHL